MGEPTMMSGPGLFFWKKSFGDVFAATDCACLAWGGFCFPKSGLLNLSVGGEVGGGYVPSICCA